MRGGEKRLFPVALSSYVMRAGLTARYRRRAMAAISCFSFSPSKIHSSNGLWKEGEEVLRSSPLRRWAGDGSSLDFRFESLLSDSIDLTVDPVVLRHLAHPLSPLLIPAGGVLV